MEMLYYPCVRGPDGKINVKVGRAMPRKQAEAYLKARYSRQWHNAEAIPQPVTHQYWNEILTAHGPFQIPKGFSKIRWETAGDQDVYIVGTQNGEPQAYGIYNVYDLKKKELVNKKGRIFVEMASHLLKKD